MKQRAKVALWALLGSARAKHWLVGYDNWGRERNTDIESLDYIRGWLTASVEEDDRKLANKVERYQNETNYIFSNSPVSRRQ